MNDQIVANMLQQYGTAGLVIGVAAYALRYLHTQLVTSLEKRVADAQAYASQLLALAGEQHKHMDTLADSLDSSTDASRDLRVVVEQAVGGRASAPRRPGT